MPGVIALLAFLGWAWVARNLLGWGWGPTVGAVVVAGFAALVVYNIKCGVSDRAARRSAERQRLDPASYLLDSDREWLRRHNWRGQR